jgi:LacI family repressor for deo operon, udp, cdd, tsx, nupC, and nupG
MASSESEAGQGVERRNGPRARAVGIAEVAALAGVSIATVSRALAIPERVTPATRARVLEAVRQTGYTPNVAARSLRARRSMLVLVVVPNIITPFFAELLLGVDQALSAEGYGMLIGNLHDRAEKEQHLVDLVFAGGADGVVLLNGEAPKAPTRSLADSGVPIVAVSSPPPFAAPLVLVRQREAAAAVAEHLLELGHRRLGYVAGPARNYIEHERWVGFTARLAAAGIAATEVTRFSGNFRVEAGIAAGRRFLALAAADRPTAVFAISDEMAVGFMTTVRAAGVRVPDDVSVVGFDGILMADYCQPRLTTIRQPREEMGRAAAELLLRLIAGEPIPPEERVQRLDGVLRLGASSGPAPAGGRR